MRLAPHILRAKVTLDSSRTGTSQPPTSSPFEPSPVPSLNCPTSCPRGLRGPTHSDTSGPLVSRVRLLPSTGNGYQVTVETTWCHRRRVGAPTRRLLVLRPLYSSLHHLPYITLPSVTLSVPTRVSAKGPTVRVIPVFRTLESPSLRTPCPPTRTLSQVRTPTNPHPRGHPLPTALRKKG